MERKLDFTAAWNDVMAMAKQHLGLIWPIAGVFILLPVIIMAVMVPQPVIEGVQDPDALFKILADYMSAAAPWLVITALAGMIGSLAIYHFILGGKNPTVGEALSLAAASFLAFFLATLLSGIAVMFGLFFLFVPGIYLAIKFSFAGPAIAAEGIKSPVAALSRSWALTKGNSLRIFGFILMVAIVGYVAMTIAGLILGGILGYFLPVLGTIITAALQGLLTVLMLFVRMAVYRQLATDQ
jgi:hypothetical protein